MQMYLKSLAAEIPQLVKELIQQIKMAQLSRMFLLIVTETETGLKIEQRTKSFLLSL